MIVCRTCGHSNPDGAQFCVSCKSFLEFTGEPAGTPTASPGTTGGILPGTPVASSGSSGTGSGSTSGGPPTTTDRGTGIVTDASMPPCPRCGTPNESSRTFCKYCGEQLVVTSAVVVPPTKTRFAVDPRLAIGGGIIALVIVAVAAFAVIGGGKPSPSAPPASAAASASPLATLVAGSASPPASVPPPSATASPSDSPSESPSESPPASASPTDSAEPSSPPPSEEPTLAPPTAPTTIAFYAVRNGQADIFTLPPKGGTLTNLTNDVPPDSDPKWSPDGRRLAFDSRRVDGERNIWVLELDGTFNALTHDQGANNAFPTWSPDGQQIAFVHSGELWVMNSVDGSDAHPLTTGAEDTRPTWSTSGQIAYQRTASGTREIWTVAADASAGAEVLISADKGGGRQPSWSPDGSQIAFATVIDGAIRIAVADAGGANRTTVTTGAICPCQFPTWSPDGGQIAFSAGVSKKEQIYVVSASGGTPKRISDGDGQNLAPGWGS